MSTAAEHLLQLRRSGVPGDRLPEAIRPRDSREALVIQDEVTAALGGDVAGWKVSAPKDGRIPYAPLLRSLVYSAVPCPVPVVNGKVQIEPEIAFVLKSDLPPRATPYDRAEIVAAIGEVHIGLEFIVSRYADAGANFSEKLADHISNGGYLVGPIVDVAPEDAPVTIDFTIDGKAVAGKHPDGHALAGLLWFANYWAANGEGLKAGQVVTTGSYAGINSVDAGRSIEVRFGSLGTMQFG